MGDGAALGGLTHNRASESSTWHCVKSYTSCTNAFGAKQQHGNMSMPSKPKPTKTKRPRSCSQQGMKSNRPDRCMVHAVAYTVALARVVGHVC